MLPGRLQATGTAGGGWFGEGWVPPGLWAFAAGDGPGHGQFSGSDGPMSQGVGDALFFFLFFLLLFFFGLLFWFYFLSFFFFFFF